VYERISTNSATKSVVFLQQQENEFDAGPASDDSNASSILQSIGALIAHSQGLAKFLDLKVSLASRWGKRKTSNPTDEINPDQSAQSTYKYNYQDAGLQLTKKSFVSKKTRIKSWVRTQVRTDSIESEEKSSFSGFESNSSLDRRQSSFSGALGSKLTRSHFLVELEGKWTKWESVANEAYTARSKVGINFLKPEKRQSNRQLWLYTLLSQTVHSPSIYQQYSEFGSADLRPEKSSNLKVAIKLNQKRWSSEVSYTYKKLDQLIDFDFLNQTGAFGFINKAKANIQAIQTSLHMPAKNHSGFFAGMNGTWLEAKEGGNQLVRRPLFQGASHAGYAFGERNSLSIKYHLVGKRLDVDAVGNKVWMKPVQKINLSYEQPLSNSVTAGISVGNLLGESRQITWGYQRLPRHALVQLNWKN
jgi:outer membrane cobalamin receptor